MTFSDHSGHKDHVRHWAKSGVMLDAEYLNSAESRLGRPLGSYPSYDEQRSEHSSLSLVYILSLSNSHSSTSLKI